jgi:putative transposase
VLIGDIDARLKEMLHQIATDNGFTISEIETDSDHIHLLIDCTPHHSIPTIIKALKGVSARLLFKEFPNLKNKLCGVDICGIPFTLSQP